MRPHSGSNTLAGNYYKEEKRWPKSAPITPELEVYRLDLKKFSPYELFKALFNCKKYKGNKASNKIGTNRTGPWNMKRTFGRR